MNRMGSGLPVALAVVLMMVTGCSRDAGEDSSVATAEPEATVPAAEVAEQVEEAEAVEEADATEVADAVEEAGAAVEAIEVDSELAGTSWQLVKIVSMDDSVYEPEDGSRYSLLLRSNGTASIRADCNLGNGSWNSESTGQLQFGLMATTMAICSPVSISDTYLKQFEWVRSYVFQDGHLFLATMADGAIIEFEPVMVE